MRGALLKLNPYTEILITPVSTSAYPAAQGRLPGRVGQTTSRCDDEAAACKFATLAFLQWCKDFASSALWQAQYLLKIPAMLVERGRPTALAWKHMRVYFDWKSDGLMVGQCRSVLLHVTCSIKSIFLVVIGIFDGDEDDVVMCLSACDIYTARLWVPPGQLSIVSFSDGSSSSQRLATSLWYFMSLTDIWHWFFSLYFDRSPSPIKFYLLWALWFAWGVFIVFIWETKVVNKM